MTECVDGTEKAVAFRLAAAVDPGDKAQARRMRRSFRFCVAACVSFTITLWIAEKYSRYDLTESQYIMSLTLPTESARPVLRAVVKRDAAEHETGTSKYLMALAEREEQDQILPMYQRAYALEPNNAALAIEYGCALFLAGKPAEARERFREAAVQAPQNALPRYLEAAAVAFEAADERVPPFAGSLSESLALVAKTNTNSDPVVFPAPLWSSYLPTGGAWHEKLRRQTVDACCAPLYRYKDLVMGSAKKALASGQEQYWDSWIETLQVMGERVAATGEPGSVQMIAGINIQLAALEQRLAMAASEKAPSESRLLERQSALKNGLAAIIDFENKRDDRIAAIEQRYQLPWSLCWRSLLALTGFLLAAVCANQVMRPRSDYWALPHASWAKRALLGGNLLLLLLLFASMAWQRQADPTRASMAAQPELAYKAIEAGWWTVLGSLITFGLLYAVIKGRAASTLPPSMEQGPLRLRLGVGSTFLRRYAGVLLGIMLCVFCIWILGFRIFTHLYPWETELLATGLADQEIEMAKSVLAMIGP